MKNKKFISIFLTSLIAIFGILSFLFFSKEIFLGLKKIETLRQDAGKLEALERAIVKAKSELENSKEERMILDSLFITQEETEQGIVPFLDGIESDLKNNNSNFQFISVDKDKKNSSIIIFSGTSRGSFAQAFRSFQILENEMYPIEITKAIFNKEESEQTGVAWVASFQANISTIASAPKPEDKNKK